MYVLNKGNGPVVGGVKLTLKVFAGLCPWLQASLTASRSYVEQSARRQRRSRSAQRRCADSCTTTSCGCPCAACCPCQMHLFLERLSGVVPAHNAPSDKHEVSLGTALRQPGLSLGHGRHCTARQCGVVHEPPVERQLLLYGALCGRCWPGHRKATTCAWVTGLLVRLRSSTAGSC